MSERTRPPGEADSLLARMGKDRFVLGFVSEQLRGAPVTAQTAARDLARAIDRIQSTQAEVATALSDGFGRVKEFHGSAEQLGELAETTFGRLESVGDALRKALTDASDLILAVGRFEKPSADAATRASVLEQTTRGVHDEVARLVELAEQINLLALNSVIEADHTGREGRPFAVLAGEIRTVAARAAEEARQVQQIVDKIESEVREATGRAGTDEQHHREGALKAGELTPDLAAMEKSLELLHSGEEDFLRQYRALLDQMQDVRTRYEQMSAVAERIGMTVEDVGASMRNQAGAVTDLAKSLEGVIGSTESRSGIEALREHLHQAAELLGKTFSFERELSGSLDNSGRLASDQASSASLAQRKAERLELLATALAERGEFVLECGKRLQSGWESRVLPRMLDLLGHVEQTARRTHEAVEAMGALEGRVRSIDVVCASIARLVLKIDVLAVSGSIEAVKVGAQGGGFGAVAAQVVQIAGDASQLADQIRLSSFNVQLALSVIRRTLDEAEGAARAEHARSERARENVTALETSIRGLGAELDAVYRSAASIASRAGVALKDTGILLRSAEGATGAIDSAARVLASASGSLSAVSRGVDKVAGRLES